MAEAILGIGLVVFVAHFFVALFKKTRIPDVLLLTMLGLVIGPATHIVTPEEFGKVGGVISTIALIVILFESGITLDPQVIPKIFRPTLFLTLGTFTITVGLTMVVGIYQLKLSAMMAGMLGITLGGTSAAVVIALVKSMKMRDPAGTILIMESALGDVLCIILLLGFLEGAQRGQLHAARMIGSIFASLVCAGIVGVLGGILWLSLLDVVRRSPNTAFTTLAFLFVLYGITDLIGFSGAVAALTFGATLTNYRWMRIQNIPYLAEKQFAKIPEFDHNFYNEVLFLLKVFFFIYLGVSIRFTDPWLLLDATGLVALVYFARIWITKATTRLTSVDWEDAGLMSILAPKGLVSAVLASIPVSAKIPGAELARDFTYLVVILSIIVTAVWIPLIQRKPFRGFYEALYKRKQAVVSMPADVA